MIFRLPVALSKYADQLDFQTQFSEGIFRASTNLHVVDMFCLQHAFPNDLAWELDKLISCSNVRAEVFVQSFYNMIRYDRRLFYTHKLSSYIKIRCTIPRDTVKI